jgi:hypothetical protein
MQMPRLKQELIRVLQGGPARRIMWHASQVTVHMCPSDGRSWDMRIESSGHSQGNPRLYEVVEHTPKTGKSPTVWAWPELMGYLKIAGQPVAGPWPPHQEPRPDPEEDSLPVAVPDPEAARPRGAAAPQRASTEPSPSGPPSPTGQPSPSGQP